MYWNLFLKYLFIFIIFLLLILSLTNSSSSIQKNEEILLKTEDKEAKPWENYQIDQQERKKREPFTVTSVIILVVWSMVVGPFVQMQVTGNIDLVGSFTESVSIMFFWMYYSKPEAKFLGKRHTIRFVSTS
ncbi:hypothetical protein Mgra_00008576 [Meloidogyne graminicola]|uniref:Uncharacterized protein n=1 Tax=Meloidogyne graminicola TaxID=189291 RepID=A0A8S9ZFC8_9BILA|nr:hypothetical protein Mgra_00008576 [Meloidogyne graminicola]